ncbi:hypothetical protein VSS37_12740 [Candidatus Thiothrix sp. Deng01]|uniref:Endonuclease GajA/Old nuclease/RecF-like AAA domain-containing protein n=1 Tax=Candidatus Thiothrix phosphatis TaxID=3112415 RepID=A0ABU6CYD6_9GAMM|nr:hypothetical protein [Candidatus Thiothrix sp. Deng01]MEB4591851.1 hypothetical protein [Candidatus Thiothrix sp. Deng01]
MYIEKIKIDKFRVLEDIEIHFQPPGGETADPETGNVINVIAGVNGGGKTTILNLINSTDERVQTNQLMPVNSSVNRHDIKILDGDRISISLNEEVEKSTIYRESGDLLHYETKRTDCYTSFWCLPELSNFADKEKREQFIKSPKKIVYFKFGWIIGVVEGKYTDIFSRIEKMIYIIVTQFERESEKPPKERMQDAIDKFNSSFDGIIINSKLKSVDVKGDGFNAIFYGINSDLLSLRDLSDGEKSLYISAINLIASRLENSIILDIIPKY